MQPDPIRKFSREVLSAILEPEAGLGGSLPALFLFLQRPEIVGDPIDVFLGQEAFPGRHVQRRRRLGRVIDGRRLAVANNLDYFFLGVVVRGVEERWDLAALTIGVGHSSLQLEAVTADTSESGETLLSRLDRRILS